MYRGSATGEQRSPQRAMDWRQWLEQPSEKVQLSAVSAPPAPHTESGQPQKRTISLARDHGPGTLYLFMLKLNTCNAGRESGKAKLTHSDPNATCGDSPLAVVPRFRRCVKRGFLNALRGLLFKCAIRISLTRAKSSTSIRDSRRNRGCSPDQLSAGKSRRGRTAAGTARYPRRLRSV